MCLEKAREIWVLGLHKELNLISERPQAACPKLILWGGLEEPQPQWQPVLVENCSQQSLETEVVSKAKDPSAGRILRLPAGTLEAFCGVGALPAASC